MQPIKDIVCDKISKYEETAKELEYVLMDFFIKCLEKGDMTDYINLINIDDKTTLFYTYYWSICGRRFELYKDNVRKIDEILKEKHNYSLFGVFFRASLSEELMKIKFFIILLLKDNKNFIERIDKVIENYDKGYYDRKNI